MKTIRRDRLMRLAEQGKLICIESYHYDEMTGQEISKKELPVRLKKNHEDFKEGFCNLSEYDFTGKCGYASLSDDGKTVHLGVHSNLHFDFRIIDGAAPLASNGPAKAHRPENARMQAYLAANGIQATPRYLFDGSLKGCWHIYNTSEKWTLDLAAKLTALGFTDFDGKPLGEFSGNGGTFSCTLRGHNEFLQEPEPAPQSDTAPTAPPVGIIKTKHTQKGYDLFVVQLPERVSRPKFMQYLGEAKELGGWWSSYDKDGAVPGFQFKTELKATAFLHVLDGKPSLEQAQVMDTAPQPEQIKPEPAPAPQKVSSKFRAWADGLTAQIEDKRRPMTQNPTPKRNRQYRQRLHDSDNLERTQHALIALAEAHEAGTVPAVLAGVKTKNEIYSLVYKGTEGGGYYEVIPSEHYSDTSPAGVALQAMIDRPGKKDNAREISLIEQQISLSTIPGFFATPPELVQRMIEYVKPAPGERILEPSAGSGAIACAINSGSTVDALEVNYTLRGLLALKGVNLVGHDFMEFQPAAPYDGVCMNPPFENAQDIAHIRRAWDMLKPGGRLAAICSPGFTFRDGKHAEFREWLNEIGADVTDIEAGAFKRSGTGVSAKLILVQK